MNLPNISLGSLPLHEPERCMGVELGLSHYGENMVLEMFENRTGCPADCNGESDGRVMGHICE